MMPGVVVGGRVPLGVPTHPGGPDVTVWVAVWLEHMVIGSGEKPLATHVHGTQGDPQEWMQLRVRVIPNPVSVAGLQSWLAKLPVPGMHVAVSVPGTVPQMVVLHVPEQLPHTIWRGLFGMTTLMVTSPSASHCWSVAQAFRQLLVMPPPPSASAFPPMKMGRSGSLAVHAAVARTSSWSPAEWGGMAYKVWMSFVAGLQ